MSTRSLESLDTDDAASTASGDSSYTLTSEDERRLAQEEWEEGLEQLNLVLSVVAMPFLGKWLGRRWSQWAYARYLRVGLGKSFFLGGFKA